MPCSFSKPHQFVGANSEDLAHLVKQREVGLDFRALIARVPVFFDAQGFGEVSGANVAPFRPQLPLGAARNERVPLEQVPLP